LGPAEDTWTRAREKDEAADQTRRAAAEVLDGALARDPRSAQARALSADIVFARLLTAERWHQRAIFGELRARLAVYDDGTREAILRAPAHVRVETTPPGAALSLSRFREDAAGHLVESPPSALATDSEHELEPGSYLLVARLPGRYETRYPFLVSRGERRLLRVALPALYQVPAGMVYVPAGNFLYGSGDDEDTRQFLDHQPLREIALGSFLIARTEVTNGQFLEYLRHVPEQPDNSELPGGFTLSRDGRALVRIRERMLREGQPYCPPEGPCIDWSTLPVGRVNRTDGTRYTAWLSGTGRLPGARLCTDREWERAARGADDRSFPQGNAEPGPGDACSLYTYEGNSSASRSCPVATHPASRSIFGVEDMIGNVWEPVSGSADRAQRDGIVERGGGYRDDGLAISILNRALQSGETGRFGPTGMRVCADGP
jgi:formylglycine-generating enzyme required for sulfatase activity